MNTTAQGDMENNEKELSQFQIRNISLLTHLLKNNAITDEIVENLRLSELDYFSLLDKYHLLEKRANIDEKTCLLKFKKNYLTDIIKTASRVFYGMVNAEYHISLVRFDIDDFRIFNNRFSHELGDQVLVKFAGIIRSHSRPTDYAIRFGGEEFDIILPGTNQNGAINYLNKIYATIKENFTIDYNNEHIRVTASAGSSSFIYTFNEKKYIDEASIESVYTKIQMEADDALYEAKYLGKNRFCLYSEDKKEVYPKIREVYIR